MSTTLDPRIALCLLLVSILMVFCFQIHYALMILTLIISTKMGAETMNPSRLRMILLNPLKNEVSVILEQMFFDIL